MRVDNNIVNIDNSFFEILSSIDENINDKEFLSKLSESKIIFGQYFPNESKVLQQLNVLFQVITLRFFSPSESWTDIYRISDKFSNDELKKYNLKREYWFKNTGKESRNSLKGFQKKLKEKVEVSLAKNNYLYESLDYEFSKVDNIDIFSWKEDYWKILSTLLIFVFFYFLKRFRKKDERMEIYPSGWRG